MLSESLFLMTRDETQLAERAEQTRAQQEGQTMATQSLATTVSIFPDADYSVHAPFRYPHPGGSNTCWVVCAMELRRLLPGPTHPLVTQYFMTIFLKPEDRVAALYALRETPENGGIGAGFDREGQMGYSLDIFHGLFTLLGMDPWWPWPTSCIQGVMVHGPQTRKARRPGGKR